MFGWSPIGVLTFFAKAFRILGILLGCVSFLSLFVPSMRAGLPLEPSLLLVTLSHTVYYVGGGILAWAALSALASVAAKQEPTP